MENKFRYNNILFNDVVNGEGVCVSFWTQGCPHRCKGCHNPDTWDFNGGKEFTKDTMDSIITGINENGVLRNFSILGGEPLCKENRELVSYIVTTVRMCYSGKIKIYLWTGYTMEELLKSEDKHIKIILDLVNVIIDGPYIDSKRDIRLKLRGSSNQHIWTKPYTITNSFSITPVKWKMEE